jgi:hypothetical protein
MYPVGQREAGVGDAVGATGAGVIGTVGLVVGRGDGGRVGRRGGETLLVAAASSDSRSKLYRNRSLCVFRRVVTMSVHRRADTAAVAHP